MSGKRSSEDLSMEPETPCVLRILCTRGSAGAIIGEGGQSINDIRSSTGACVVVEDSVPDCEERVVVMTEEDMEAEECQSAQALMAVVEKLAEAEGEEADDESFSVKLLVYTSQTGAIIGKGGQTIKKLRTDHKANIRILPKLDVPICASVTTDVVCQVSGLYEDVCDAVEAIAALLRETPAEELSLPSSVRTPSHGDGPRGPDMKFRLLVPGKKVGLLVGRSGEAIQKIRQDTKSHVQLSRTVAGYRAVQFTSPNTDICPAQEALIRCVYCLNTEEPLNKNSAKLIIPKREVGQILGKGGATMKHIREASAGCLIRVINDDTVPEIATGQAMITMEGNPRQLHEALVLVALTLRESTTRTGPRSSSKASPAKKAKRTAVAAAVAPEDATTTVMSVDASQVGGIIGKGGANITSVREESGAAVKIAKSAGAEAGKFDVTVYGLPEQVEAAEKLIQALLEAQASEAMETDSPAVNLDSTSRMVAVQ